MTGSAFDQVLFDEVIGALPQDNLTSLRNDAARKFAEKQAVLKDIDFPGWIDPEVRTQWLEQADIYGLPTWREAGLPISVLEAMACGLPVICYDHGGQTDFLRDKETGYLVSLNDQEAFRKRCQRLIEDAALRRSMGEDNQRLVEKYYIGNCAIGYEDVFYEAMGITPPNGGCGCSTYTRASAADLRQSTDHSPER